MWETKARRIKARRKPKSRRKTSRRPTKKTSPAISSKSALESRRRLAFGFCGKSWREKKRHEGALEGGGETKFRKCQIDTA
jgi:hypothetical protein